MYTLRLIYTPSALGYIYWQTTHAHMHGITIKCVCINIPGSAASQGKGSIPWACQLDIHVTSPSVIYSYNPGCYYTSPRWSRGWVLITRISYECTWVITGLLPKRLHQLMLSLWTVNNDFRLCSPIKASFGTNNLYDFFSGDIYLSS